MGSGSTPPGGDLIVLGHLIMHGHHEVREGGVSRVDRRGVGSGSGIRAAGDVAHERGIKQPPEKGLAGQRRGEHNAI